MASLLHPRKWTKAPNDEDLSPQKRISTPAGMRLSVIMNGGRRTSTASQQPPLSPITPTHPPRLSFENDSNNAPMGIRIVDPSTVASSPHRSDQFALGAPTPSPPYTQSVFSEKSVFAASAQEQDQTKKRKGFVGGFPKRVLIALVVLLLVLLALIIGLAAGLSSKSKSKSTTSSPSAETSPSATSGPSAQPAKPTVPVSKEFPLGTYSMHTFLDSIYTDCTSSSSTWQCPPNMNYYQDPVKSLATFPFTVTGSPGSYKIAPTSNVPAFNNITFPPTNLVLYNSGQASESYRFRITTSKEVNTSVNGTSAVCTFSATTFQGYLYTKMGSEYPAAGQAVPQGSSQPWPFAVKIEQIVGGGENTPSCVKAGTTERLTNGLVAQDAGHLCSCLYKNFKTPAVN